MRNIVIVVSHYVNSSLTMSSSSERDTRVYAMKSNGKSSVVSRAESTVYGPFDVQKSVVIFEKKKKVSVKNGARLRSESTWSGPRHNDKSGYFGRVFFTSYGR